MKILVASKRSLQKQNVRIKCIEIEKNYNNWFKIFAQGNKRKHAGLKSLDFDKGKGNKNILEQNTVNEMRKKSRINLRQDNT